MHSSSTGIGRVPISLALASGLIFSACSGATGSATPTTGSVASGTDGIPSPGGQAQSPGASGPVPSEAVGTSLAPSRACSLATADQVKQLIGAAGTPTETDYAANYEVCQWLTTGTGNTNALRLGVTIKLSPGDNGFGPVPAADSPQPVTGVGDNATYGANGDDTGFGTKLLVANKGPVSISLGVQYGGSLRASGSTQANLAAVVNAIFSELGY